ncbi:mechanosensitive ion channel family protein [Rathayibacter sp. VKM Ac-2630]|uniref:mechanosensitive ion channel family protein n=1 Tax=Rathayibacter sp. VKM Ac-2630 TaxID=1938617 RepID=UPI00191C3B12|nr:hypothetical protein [Rathayibacter sp. VKM Ac-2630]
MDFPAALQNGLAAVIAFVPLALLFLLILIVGLIVAKLIEKGLSRLLTKVGFDRAVERGGIKKALANSKLDASDIVSKIIYYTLVLFVLQFAFGVFGPNPVSDLLQGIIGFLPKIIVAIIIIVIAAAIAAGAKGLIQNTLGGLSYGKLLGNIVAIFILFLGATAALNQIEVATTVSTPILIAVLAIIAAHHRRCRRRPHQADAAALGGDPHQGRGRGAQDPAGGEERPVRDGAGVARRRGREAADRSEDQRAPRGLTRQHSTGRSRS